MNSSSHARQLRSSPDRDVRTLIVEAAAAHFGRYGYEKTTVSDVARSIGFSKAYVYKFFESKQAIGEVICSDRVREIVDVATHAMAGGTSASERLRLMFRALVEACQNLSPHDRKLYEIAAATANPPWDSVRAYDDSIRLLIAQIAKEGRDLGEFERKTPLDEVVNAIYLVLRPYIDPLQLQHNLEHTDDAATHLCGMLLRGLAP